MNKEKRDKLIEKLEWQDMPQEVSHRAVQLIVNNYICCLSDCCGVQPSSSDAVLDILLSDDFTSDQVFERLFINDYYTLNDTEHIRLAGSLRWEIEELMRGGEFFEDAREDWDI